MPAPSDCTARRPTPAGCGSPSATGSRGHPDVHDRCRDSSSNPSRRHVAARLVDPPAAVVIEVPATAKVSRGPRRGSSSRRTTQPPVGSGQGVANSVGLDGRHRPMPRPRASAFGRPPRSGRARPPPIAAGDDEALPPARAAALLESAASTRPSPHRVERYAGAAGRRAATKIMPTAEHRTAAGVQHRRRPAGGDRARVRSRARDASAGARRAGQGRRSTSSAMPTREPV